MAPPHYRTPLMAPQNVPSPKCVPPIQTSWPQPTLARFCGHHGMRRGQGVWLGGACAKQIPNENERLTPGTKSGLRSCGRETPSCATWTAPKTPGGKTARRNPGPPRTPLRGRPHGVASRSRTSTSGLRAPGTLKPSSTGAGATWCGPKAQPR